MIYPLCVMASPGREIAKQPKPAQHSASTGTRLLTQLFYASLPLACLTPAAMAQTQCSYQATFLSLQQQLPSLPTAQGILALQRFYAENENAQFCELARIEELLDSKEAALVSLRQGSAELKPQHLMRCNLFNGKTAQCQSPYEDLTAHPRQNNLNFKPWPVPTQALRLKVDLPQAKLLAVYHTTLAAALDGKPAKRLSTSPQFNWQGKSKNEVLIAIYKTPGPWAYRKLVWYFE